MRLGVGDVVPADLRLLEADGLECDEAVSTGESLAEPKTSKPVPPASPLDLPSCALMGTVVHAGTGLGVVVRTGPRTAFGQIATRLGQRNEAMIEGGHAVAGNPLDQALWEAAPTGETNRSGDGKDPLGGARRLALAPFDYDRRLASALVAELDGRRRVLTKGAPEVVLSRCPSVPPAATSQLDRLFAEGARVIAVATRDGAGLDTVTAAEERDLELAGFLVFSDPSKQGAAGSLERLRSR